MIEMWKIKVIWNIQIDGGAFKCVDKRSILESCSLLDVHFILFFLIPSLNYFSVCRMIRIQPLT